MILVAFVFFILIIIFISVYSASYIHDYKNNFKLFLKGCFDGVKSFGLIVLIISLLFYLSNAIVLQLVK